MSLPVAALLWCAFIAITVRGQFSVSISDLANRRGMVGIKTSPTATLAALGQIDSPTANIICNQLNLGSLAAFAIPYFQPTSVENVQPWASLSVSSTGYDCWSAPLTSITLMDCTNSTLDVTYYSGVVCPVVNLLAPISAAGSTVTIFAGYCLSPICSCQEIIGIISSLGPLNEFNTAMPNQTVCRSVNKPDEGWGALLLYVVDGPIPISQLNYLILELYSSNWTFYNSVFNSTYVNSGAPLSQFGVDPPAPTWAVTTTTTTAAPTGTTQGPAMVTPSPLNNNGTMPPFPSNLLPINTTGWSFRFAPGSGSATSGIVEVLPPGSNAWGNICSRMLAPDSIRAVCGSLGFVGAAHAEEIPNTFLPTLGPMYVAGISCNPSANATQLTLNDCAWIFDSYGAAGMCDHDFDLAISCGQGVPQYPSRLITALVLRANFTTPSVFASQVASMLSLQPYMINVTSNKTSGNFVFVSFYFQFTNLGFAGSMMGSMPNGSMMGPMPNGSAMGPMPNGSAMGPTGSMPNGSMVGPPGGSNGGGGEYVLTGYDPNVVAALFMSLSPYELLSLSIYEVRDNVTLPNGDLSPITSSWKFSLDNSSTGPSYGGKFGRLQVQPGTNAAIGTVCSAGASSAAALGICQLLGFSTPNAFLIPHFAYGSGVIFLSNLACLPSASCTTLSISNLTFKNNNCTHADDLGLLCGVGVGPATFTSSSNFSVTVRMETYAGAQGDGVFNCMSLVTNIPRGRFQYMAESITGTESVIITFNVSSPATQSDLTVGDVVLILNATSSGSLWEHCDILEVAVTNGPAVVWSSTSAPTTNVPVTFPPPPTTLKPAGTTTSTTPNPTMTTVVPSSTNTAASTAVPTTSSTTSKPIVNGTTSVPTTMSPTAKPNSTTTPSPPTTIGTTTPAPSNANGSTTSAPSNANGSTTSAPSNANGSTTSAPSNANGTTTSAPSNANGTTTSAPSNANGTTTSAPSSANGSTTPAPSNANGTTTSAPSSANGSTTPAPLNSTNATTSMPATTPAPISTTAAPVINTVSFQANGTNFSINALLSALSKALGVPVSSMAYIMSNTSANVTVNVTFNDATVSSDKLVAASVQLANNGSLTSLGVTQAAAVIPPFTSSPPAAPASTPKTGVIVGVVIGVLVVAVIIGVVIKKKCSSAEDKTVDSHGSPMQEMVNLDAFLLQERDAHRV